MTENFTSDEKMAEFCVNDKMIDLKCYVDAMDGMKAIKIKGTASSLFSFVVNNDGKERMHVLIWGEKAKKYIGHIQLRKIVEISGGTLKGSNPKFRNPNEKVNSLECNAQRSSIIQIHVDHANAAEPIIAYRPVEFLDVITLDAGPIEVKGYIKTIQKMETQKSFFGYGVIVNQFHSLIIKINEYTENSRLHRGVPVRVRGERDKRSGEIIKIKIMDDIDILEELLIEQNLMISFKRLDSSKRQNNGIM